MGRVKTIERRVRTKGNTFRTVKERICSNPSPDYYGYPRISFSKEGTVTILRIHRLVAFHFILPIEGKIFVNHKNGIRHDNRAENLEWCTTSENALHGFRSNGRINPHKGKFGEYHCTSKPIMATNLNTKTEVFYGSSLLAANEFLNISVVGIYSVLHGRLKTTHGYTFRYATLDEIAIHSL